MENKTKAQLITEIKAKTKRATPIVKKVFYPGLKYKKKATLQRYTKIARVTRCGDIDLSK